MTAIPQGRLAGLDVVRAWMMLLGIVVHGTAFCLTQIHSHYWVGLTGLVSGVFRMEAFFAISGLLTAKVLEKASVAVWLKKRMLALLIPFLFGVIVISPIGGIVSNLLDQQPAILDIRVEIGHLWFLPTLFCCCVLVAILENVQRRRRSAWAQFVQGCASSRPALLFLSFSCLGFVLLVLCLFGTALSAAIPVHPLAKVAHGLFVTIGQTPYYFLFFGFGFMLVRSPALCRLALDEPRTKLLTVAAGAIVLLALYNIFGADLYVLHRPWDNPIPLLLAVAKLLVAPSACALIVRMALKVRNPPRYLTALSGASYTMYILHFYVAAVITHLVARLQLPDLLFVFVVVSATLVATFVFHIVVVANSPALQLVLNGKLPASRPAGKAAARQKILGEAPGYQTTMRA